MLQEASYVSMMYRLCSRVILEFLDKCRIIREEFLQKYFVIVLIKRLYECHQVLVHLLYIFLGAWHIIGLNILSLVCNPDLLDVELKFIVERCHLTINLDEILCLKVSYSICQLPDFSGYASCLIHKLQVVICLS